MRASESDRGLLCPASLVREKTGPRSINADKAANWGTLCHLWKETGDTENNKTLAKKLLRSGTNRESLWPKASDSHGHECTFSIHLESLQLRVWTPKGSKYPRDHWKRRHPRNTYLTGSIDWLSKVSRKGLPELPWVDDLKTGYPVIAKRSKQLRSYALVPWVMGDCATDVWVSITNWPKYPLAGKPKRNWHLLKSADLAAHWQKLKWTINNTHIAKPSDDACRFCLCKPDCEEYLEEFN